VTKSYLLQKLFYSAKVNVWKTKKARQFLSAQEAKSTRKTLGLLWAAKRKRFLPRISVTTLNRLFMMTKILVPKFQKILPSIFYRELLRNNKVVD